MNGYPAIDPAAAARVERVMQAREHVNLWTNYLKTVQASGAMFSLIGPLADDFALLLGQVDVELDAAGYVLASHSHAPIGKQGEALLCSWTFLVRAKGNAPRVVLA